MSKKKDLGKIFLFSKKYDYGKLKGGYGSRNKDGSGHFEGKDGTKFNIYSDGSGYFEHPDGSKGTRFSDGSGYYEDADGKSGYKFSDGTGYFENDDGSSGYYENEDQFDEENIGSYAVGEKIGKGIAGAIIGLSEASKRYMSKANLDDKKESESDWKYILIIFGFLFFLIGFCFFISYRHSTPRKDEIKLTISAKECKGMSYEEVEEIFADMGFSNIKSKPKEDLILGWLNKEGETDSVTINNKKFQKGDIVPQDARVVIIYHSYKEE